MKKKRPPATRRLALAPNSERLKPEPEASPTRSHQSEKTTAQAANLGPPFQPTHPMLPTLTLPLPPLNLKPQPRPLGPAPLPPADRAARQFIVSVLLPKAQTGQRLDAPVLERLVANYRDGTRLAECDFDVETITGHLLRLVTREQRTWQAQHGQNLPNLKHYQTLFKAFLQLQTEAERLDENSPTRLG